MAESQIAHAPTLVAKPPPDGDRLPEGTPIGDYVIDKFLGAGAMGEVYAGHHPIIGKRIAIKVLKRELAADKEAAERFVREARAVNVVEHPNVIDVFNFGRLDDGRLFLMMDLVDGKSLRSTLADGLSVDAALAVLSQIADALDAAHGKGVIHRDLKPDNVMLNSETPPKVFVLDFGIAKLVSTSATNNGTLTEKGSWLGTPGYMAPEQWSADGAGPASDRYALGVMAYEMLSGTLPFHAPTLPQMMEQHFRSPVPALSAKGTARKPPEHHQTLDPVLARAMAKNPDARFATGRALVDALRAAAGGTAVEAPARKRSLAIPAAAGTAVLGLAVVGFIVVRGDKDEPADRDRPAAVPAEGFVKLTVISMPDQAKVTRDGQLLGRTPITVDVRKGGAIKLAITKPGYRAVTDDVTPSKDTMVRKDLQVVTGFEGVWTMPDGKLRGFWRTKNDKVDVFRLETVNGERELWRTCDLVDPPADADGNQVVFVTAVEMTDERGVDASCSVPTRVEYRYDPVRESLEVRAETVKTAKQADGKCLVVTRDPGPPTLLARAERGDTRSLTPPVGKPPTKADFEGKGDRKLEELKKLEAAKKNASNNAKKGGDSFDNIGDVPQKGQLTNAPRPVPKQVPPNPPPNPKNAIDPANSDDANPPPQQADKAPNAPNKALKQKTTPPQQKLAPPPQQPQPRQAKEPQAPRGDSQQVGGEQQQRRKN